MREAVIQKIVSSKIIAIVRGVEAKKCLMLAEALFAGGIEMIEVTFNLDRPDEYSKTTNALTREM